MTKWTGDSSGNYTTDFDEVLINEDLVMEPNMDIAAIKNFNIYDILQPERVHNVKTDLLVPIDDEKPNPELNGSFTDKVTKSEYDLVDLFENILVSPQHVKRKNEDFEFPDFESEALEITCSNKKKEIEITKDHGHVSPQCFLKNINEYSASETTKHDVACKENMPTERNDISLYYHSSDLSKQYLAFCNSRKNKELEKAEIAKFTPNYTQINSSNCKSASALEMTSKIHENVEVETTRVRSLDEILDNVISKKYCLSKLERLESEPSKDEVDNLKQPLNTFYNKVIEEKVVKSNNETFTVNHLKLPLNVTLKNNSDEVKNTPLYFKAVDDENKLKNQHIDIKHLDTLKFVSEKTQRRDTLVKVYQNDIKSSLIDLNKPVIASKFKPPIPMLQTVKKDKTFAKRRIVKTDKEKAGFTKGPDIYEKSLVLPQIMERLAIRKKNLDARKNVVRKLILDCPNQVTEVSEFSPVVLQADCKKERLKNLETRKAFAEFINSGRIS